MKPNWRIPSHFALAAFASLALFGVYDKVSSLLIPQARYGDNFGKMVETVGDPPGDRFTIVDFASHFNFAKQTWLGNTTVRAGQSVYSVGNHRAINQAWFGRSNVLALPFGYSPTLVLLLLPLVPMTSAIAFIAFNLIGLLLMIGVFSPADTRRRWGLIALVSPLADACVMLGQTAFMTLAGLFALRRAAGPDAGRRGLAVGAVLLWALTAKPPLALIGTVALLAERRFKVVAYGWSLAALGSLLIIPWLGWRWPVDYLSMATNYNQVDAPALFAWSLGSVGMTNVRGLLTSVFSIPDNIAYTVGTGLWVLANVSIIVFGVRRRLPEHKVWSLALLTYLLFFPHITVAEDLHLLLLIPYSINGERIGFVGAGLTTVAICGSFFSRSLWLTKGDPLLAMAAMLAIKSAAALFVLLGTRSENIER